MIAPNPIFEKPPEGRSVMPLAPNPLPPNFEKPVRNRINFTDLHLDKTKKEKAKLPEKPRSAHSSDDHPLVKSLNQWLKGFYEKNKASVDWIDKTLLDDKSMFRMVFSLENELAEALDPSMKQLKMPEGITKLVYRTLWGFCYIITSTRVAVEALKRGDAVKGLKKLVQDGISVVALTTYFARALNWLQDKIEDRIGVPSIIKNLLRPLITTFGCVKVMHYFDEYAGVPGGELAVKGVEKLLAMTRKPV